MGVSWLTELDDDFNDDFNDDFDETDPPRRNRLRLVALVFAGWLAVSLIVLLGLLTFGGHRSADKPLAGSTPATSAPDSQPSTSAPARALPDGWKQQSSDDQTNCAAHSYGQVQVFFAKTPCSSVHRMLATTSQGGRTVVVAASVVTFDSASQAARYWSPRPPSPTGRPRSRTPPCRQPRGGPSTPADQPGAGLSPALRPG